jgi:hypothetical protein
VTAYASATDRLTSTRARTATFVAGATAFVGAASLTLDLLHAHHWGGHFASLAIGLDAICILVNGRGRGWWITALVLLALARWLRGSAGVPPDPPLLVLQLIAALLMAWRAIDTRTSAQTIGT